MAIIIEFYARLIIRVLSLGGLIDDVTPIAICVTCSVWVHAECVQVIDQRSMSWSGTVAGVSMDSSLIKSICTHSSHFTHLISKAIQAI